MILPFLSIFFLISFIFVLEKNHNNEEKKKKDEKRSMMTTGFKVHCQTCIDKIQKLVLEFEGKINFSADKQKHWVTVNGIRDDIESLGKTLNSPVEIMSFRKDKEGEKKKDDKASVTTTVFRFPLHCDRCIDQIQKMVLNFEGVTNVSVDMQKDLVIVNGTMDVKALTERLGEILMRKDKKNKKNEGEKGPKTMMAFKLPQFEGVTDMSADIQKDLVTGTGTMDNIALTDYTRERLKRPVEVVAPPEKDNGGSDDGESDGDSSDGDGDKNKKNEGENGSRTRTTVFKVELDCPGCESKIRKIVSKFEGVTDMSADIQNDLVTVTGTMDNIALVNFMKEKLKRHVEIVSRPSNEDGNGSDGSDDGDGDGDSSGSGGDKNKKKDNGGDGDSDGDDGDKGEGGGGGGKMKGFKMDCMGESGYDYRYGITLDLKTGTRLDS